MHGEEMLVCMISYIQAFNEHLDTATADIPRSVDFAFRDAGEGEPRVYDESLRIGIENMVTICKYVVLVFGARENKVLHVVGQLDSRRDGKADKRRSRAVRT